MYMNQPPGFEEPGKETWVMKLLKSLYGMKQASRVWNLTFDKVVKALGFERLPCEWCIYRRHSSTGTIIFAVHVDDIVSAASSSTENDRFKNELRSHWEISDLGPAKFALGIALSRDLDSKTITLSQTALIDRVVDQFNQNDAHPVDTPMVAGSQLRRPDKSETDPTTEAWMARTPYRSLVGSLMYICRGSRPDIAYAVSRLASYLDCYRPDHWQAAIRVLRYLKGTQVSTQHSHLSSPSLPQPAAWPAGVPRLTFTHARVKGSTHTLFSTWTSYKMMHWGILGALYIFFFTSDYSTEDGISDRFDKSEG
jgi:hypothetical protein